MKAIRKRRIGEVLSTVAIAVVLTLGGLASAVGGLASAAPPQSGIEGGSQSGARTSQQSAATEETESESAPSAAPTPVASVGPKPAFSRKLALSRSGGSYVKGMEIPVYPYWLGTWVAYGGQVFNQGLCIDAHAKNPESAIASTPAKLKKNTSVSIPANLTITVTQMAYLMKEYKPANTTYNDGDVEQAALGLLAHLNFEQGDQPQATANSLIANVQDSIRNRAKKMVAEAKTSGAASWSAGEVIGKGQTTGTFNKIKVANADGALLAGVRFTITITGPAVFTSTGTKTYTGTTKSTVIDGIKWESTGTGAVSIKINYPDAVVPWLGYAAPGTSGYQPMLTFDSGTPESKTVEGPSWDVIFDFQPKLSSQTSATHLDAPGTFKDTITVKADSSYVNGVWTKVDGAYVPVTVTTSVYWMDSAPVKSASVPGGAELVGTVSSIFEGPGDKSISVPATKAGYYIAKTMFTVSQQPAKWRTYFHGDATYDFGLANETTTARMQPTLSSQAAATHLDAPGTFTDTITLGVSGGKWIKVSDKPVPATVITNVYWTLVAPTSATPAVPSGTLLVGTVSSTFDGPGDKKISVAAGRPGYYIAQSEFKVADQPSIYREYFAGDASYQFGLANETTVGQISPKLTTKVSSKLALPGAKLSDAVTVSLGSATWPDGFTVKAEGTRYGPFDTPQAQSATVPAGAPVAGTATLAFTKAGQTLNADWTAEGPGFYTWVWKINKASQPKPELIKAGFTDDFMIAAETVSVRVPTIDHVSQTREYNVNPEGRAFDTITTKAFMASHGTYPGDGYWKADTAEATVTLYDAGIGTDWDTVGSAVPTTATVHWSGSVEAVNGTFKIGASDLDKITGFSPGHDYVFVYAFAGDDRVAPFVSDYNDIWERFHVPSPTSGLSLATQATADTFPGHEIEDTALVMGTVPNDAHLIFTAYAPQDPAAAPHCEGIPIFTSGMIPVDGPGYYKSGKTTAPNEMGTEYWIATLVSSQGIELAKGKCGVASETTLVRHPTLKTTASDAEIITIEGKEVSQITDKVCYSGLIPGETYTLTGTLRDQASGEPLVGADGKPVTGEASVTPASVEGCADVVFRLDPLILAGKTTVAFESLFYKGREISAHADLTDTNQTTTVPIIGTTATDGADGNKTISAAKEVTIKDKVCYTGLQAGRKYHLSGIQIDAATGKEVIGADGKAILGQTSFTPESQKGCVEVAFAFDASSLTAESKLVTFERLYDGEKLVALHEDITDGGQTVTVKAVTSSKSASPTAKPAALAKTGANVVALLAAAAGATGIGILLRRRTRRG